MRKKYWFCSIWNSGSSTGTVRDSCPPLPLAEALMHLDTFCGYSQETDEPCYSSGSVHVQRQQELREQSDLCRSRLAECRSQGDALVAQRNGEHSQYFIVRDHIIPRPVEFWAEPRNLLFCRGNCLVSWDTLQNECLSGSLVPATRLKSNQLAVH